MIQLALRNLISEKTRFAFSAAGIGFAVFLITVVLGLYQGWNEKVGVFVEEIEGDAWVARQGTTDFINAASILPEGTADELAGPDVEAVHELIVRPMQFEDADGTAVDVHLVGFDTQSGVGGPAGIKKGKAIPEGNEIIIDDVLARMSGVGMGDELRFGDRVVTVAGIATGGNFAFTQAGFMEIGAASDLLQMDGLTTFFIIDGNDGADMEAWALGVESANPGLAAFTSGEFASATRERILSNVIPIIGLIVGLALVVGVAVTSLTIYTTTVEKAREFGVMKAIGFNNVDLYRLVIVQSMLTGVMGFLFGVIITYLLSMFIDQVVPQFIVLVRPIDVVYVLGGTLVMAALAAIVPAKRVGGVDPAVVFRG